MRMSHFPAIADPAPAYPAPKRSSESLPNMSRSSGGSSVPRALLILRILSLTTLPFNDFRNLNSLAVDDTAFAISPSMPNSDVAPLILETEKGHRHKLHFEKKNPMCKWIFRKCPKCSKSECLCPFFVRNVRVARILQVSNRLDRVFSQDLRILKTYFHHWQRILETSSIILRAGLEDTFDFRERRIPRYCNSPRILHNLWVVCNLC